MSYRVRFKMPGRKRPAWVYFGPAKARVCAGGILEVEFKGETRRYESAYWERVSRRPGWSADERSRLVFKLIAKHGPTCVFCKRDLAWKEITLDHIKPLSMGGGSGLDNLQIACGPCNNAKGSEWDEGPAG